MFQHLPIEDVVLVHSLCKKYIFPNCSAAVTMHLRLQQSQKKFSFMIITLVAALLYGSCPAGGAGLE